MDLELKDPVEPLFMTFIRLIRLDHNSVCQMNTLQHTMVMWTQRLIINYYKILLVNLIDVRQYNYLYNYQIRYIFYIYFNFKIIVNYL